MALTDIELSARALIKLGARPIVSFADGSAESEIALLLFAPTRDGLLSSYAWSFATIQTALTPLPSPPIADFQYSYDIPNDALRILSIKNLREHGKLMRNKTHLMLFKILP